MHPISRSGGRRATYSTGRQVTPTAWLSPFGYEYPSPRRKRCAGQGDVSILGVTWWWSGGDPTQFSLVSSMSLSLSGVTWAVIVDVTWTVVVRTVVQGPELLTPTARGRRGANDRRSGLVEVSAARDSVHVMVTRQGLRLGECGADPGVGQHEVVERTGTTRTVLRRESAYRAARTRSGLPVRQVGQDGADALVLIARRRDPELDEDIAR